MNDTSPTKAERQIAWFRPASPARRAHWAFVLSQNAIEISRRALRRCHPDATKDEIDIAFVALHYGPELAARVRRELRARRDQG